MQPPPSSWVVLASGVPALLFVFSSALLDTPPPYWIPRSTW
ncbi:hypothetical protein LI90_481 [Carbonactinospora thermoautotrophica]|uniref:Uncharacterized protein n=1 Tax=Carbonactinospora thermoautotrophica TaxID=1469144 RepID=A0A132MN63_9ACTN|nr:hypothetical protein LI90_481 [Carbonactinospora thermoautotrophica]